MFGFLRFHFCLLISAPIVYLYSLFTKRRILVVVRESDIYEVGESQYHITFNMRLVGPARDVTHRMLQLVHKSEMKCLDSMALMNAYRACASLQFPYSALFVFLPGQKIKAFRMS